MGRRIPILKAKEMISILERLGFEKQRQSGSHIFFQHPDGRTTLVSRHDREDIGRGLLRQILREIEMQPEAFVEFLENRK